MMNSKNIAPALSLQLYHAGVHGQKAGEQQVPAMSQPNLGRIPK